MNSTRPSRSAFTLIEMLVVIAIIVTLAGLLFPAITGAIRNAKRNRAAAEAKNIAGAISMFYAEYKYMPVPAADQGFPPGPGGGNFGMEQTKQETSVADADFSRKVIEVLVGDNKTLNPKGINFLNARVPIVDGRYLDPWGNQYCMKLDLDYDGKVEFFSSPTQYNQIAVVYSKGPDGQLGDSASSEAFQDNVANVLLMIEK